MNTAEFRAVLHAMTNEEFTTFATEWGGTLLSREHAVQIFSANPEKYEADLCYRLKLPTEEEKRTAAAMESAGAAVSSARSARIALWISIAALTVSMIALIVSTHGRG